MSEPVVRFYGITDVGKRRDHNEDALWFSESENYGVIADGMGGRLYGEVASQMTVDLLKERFATFFPPSIRTLAQTDLAHASDMAICLLDDWIRDVNTAVWDKGQEEEKYREMGTTLALVYAFPRIAIVAHIGDSRAYQLSNGELTQLTTDHSFINSQLATGAITKEQADMSTQKNIITRAIGTSRTVKPDFKEIHAAPGDRLILCSDGLTDMVEDEVIRDIVLASRNSEEALEALVNEANANGGRDNLTVLMVEYE